MKKSILAAGALALLASTGANAADVITYQEQVVSAPSAVNWNGAYIGGTIGGSWAESKTRLKSTGIYNEKGELTSDKNYKSQKVKKTVNPDSFIGGFYAGYNFQPGFLSNSALKDVVLGIETDFLFNSGDASGKKKFKHNGEDFVYKASVKQKWNGSTRLRAGYALGSEGRFLPYFATGVSYADIQARSSIKEFDGRDSKTKTRAGWNVGAGVDYVPPIMNDHLVLRAEYRYTDFGKATFNHGAYETAAADGHYEGAKQRVKFQQNDFRVGVAYKF